MLSLAEYTAARAELRRIAEDKETWLKQELKDKSKKEKLVISNEVAEQYKAEVADVLGRTMAVTAQNAVTHYSKALTSPTLYEHPDDDIVDKIVNAQFENKYYGATLTQRLTYNEQLLRRRIIQSGAAGALDSVYTGPKFGSQLATDQRLLLGTVAKIEQDVAKEFATLTEHGLVQWTLSHRHKGEDDCDFLANNVDRGVVAYLKEKQLDLNPKGLYFADSLPNPPHPNCQCEYGLVHGVSVKHSALERAAHEVKKILRRLWGK